jgi:hypothetical protein
MSLTFDFLDSFIEVGGGQTEVDVQDLIDAIREAEATETGIAYGRIASASGKESLGGAVAVGITVELEDPWQLHFETGSYIAKVSGGNLVGGPGGDPIAYSAGVQVLLIQSAASTVIEVGESGLTPEESAALLAAAADASDAKDAAEYVEGKIDGIETDADTAATQATAAATAAGNAETEATAAKVAAQAVESVADLTRKLGTNRAVIVENLDGSKTITIYDDDDTTPLHVYTVAADALSRTPA